MKRVDLRLGSTGRLLSPYSTENRIHVGYPPRKKQGKHCKPDPSVPDENYIPLAHIGSTWPHVGILVTNMLVSGTQMSSVGGITQREDPTRGPNARGLRSGGIQALSLGKVPFKFHTTTKTLF